MTEFQSSRILDWLNFNGTLPGSPKPCQWRGYYNNESLQTTSCSQVCGDSELLMEFETWNLVTCGQWSFLMNAWATTPETAGYNFSFADALKPFESVGLEASNISYSNTTQDDYGPIVDTVNTPAAANGIIYADLISTCLQYEYQILESFSSASVEHSVPADCTTGRLFTNVLANSTADVDTLEVLLRPMTSSLKSCLSAMCSPSTLNTDVAGIGVYSSFYIQLIIAYIAALALICIPIWPTLKKATIELHTTMIVTALVDFHKAQCYFASTLQIAALIMYHTGQVAVLVFTQSQSFLDFGFDLRDSGALIVLACTAILPIAVTLLCIVPYGRQSWYLITLSLVTIILGTATLVAWARLTGQVESIRADLEQGAGLDSGSLKCAGGNLKVETIVALCGPSFNYKRPLIQPLDLKWIWVVWAVSVMTSLFCLAKKLAEDFHFASPLGPVSTHIYRNITSRRMLVGIGLVSWLACFGAQLVILTEYFQMKNISYEWSLGQIIAVTVWVPSLVEFAYIEYVGIEAASEYRHPSPMRVIKGIVYQSVHLATITRAKSLARDRQQKLQGRLVQEFLIDQ